MPEKYWPETVILWGAGATKSLGLHATNELMRLVLKISKKDFSFLNGKDEKLSNAFKKLIVEDLIKDTKISKIYDLKALEAIISTNDKLNMHELFTMLDQLIDNNMGFNAFLHGKTQFLRAERVQAAKRCLILIIEELERFSIQNTPGYTDREKMEPYYQFAKILTELMIEEAQEFENRGYRRDTRRFYLYSYAIISFNWDPIILWNLFNAHKEKNQNPVKLKDGLKLQLYDDFGTQISSAQLDGNESGIWYVTDEPQCKGINDYNYPSRIIRIGKILFPHGMFGSRICPECGKSIISFAKKWNRLSTEIFGPSILKPLQKNWRYTTQKEKIYKRGAIECPYCGQITYPYDMTLIIQSLSKKRSVPTLEELKTEMGLLMKNAKHIVFAGYSLPLDDIMVKTFFMSSISGNDKNKLKCTVINYDEEYRESGWLSGNNILEYVKKSKNNSAAECIENICDIFPLENIRVNLSGIPDVFMEDGKCSKKKVMDLLYPEEYFKEGFPIYRD
ncbi:hypothetical protein ACFHWD_02485 [Clostridium sp. MT-14]|jgi:predicted RNA-binding Zn-ribbon protein involved in translation (DUF1610 family)|uniref:Deacetylase sirtuin-type domain-containing protein n=1 Tax=Clostridium aromativorans TaxID=2836848 RepID=A0ABS8N4X3_9CLOT|nr:MULTISPECIES: hypothetical protein [Clostridium]KAA8674377.1 hypothetical protein F3O63_08255 [Clostridium sp. HV4-5-A1G]MCC9294857.1 hypothetical protein [Clostridium aromativorans]CAB1250490.1 conserved hypothetical protein [Clostridiaceae bacterium BL-3]